MYWVPGDLIYPCLLLVGLSSDSAQYSPELLPAGAVPDSIESTSDMTQLVITEQPLSCEVTSCQVAQHLESEMDNSFQVEPQLTLVHHESVDAPNPSTQIGSEMNECSFEMSYPSTHSSFDPYGFKLSPEHSTHSLLDPDDEEDLSPESNDPDLAFDPEPTSSQLNFDRYGFDLTASRVASEDVFDPYGFKLSQEEENQEVLEVCSHDEREVELCSFANKELVEPHINQEVVDPCAQDNQEVLEPCNKNNHEILDFCSNGNQEILEPRISDTKNVLDLFSIENQELVELSSPLNQEVLEPFCDDNQEPMVSHDKDEQELLQQCNQEVVETSINNKEPRAPSYYENQEVLDFCGQDNQELQGFSRNQEMQDYRSHDNQEVLDFLSNQPLPEANNNHHCVQDSEMYFNPDTDKSNSSNSTNPANSSSSFPVSEDSNSPAAMHLEGLELSNMTGSTDNSNTYKADLLSMSVDQVQATSNTSTNSDPATFNVSSGQNLLQGDLGSVFSAGGYIGCPDVADDLEPLHHRQGNPVAEPVEPVEPVRPVQPVRPVRPMRPPRPSLLVSGSKTHRVYICSPN